jgi:S-DNA-T family DNA segregation ATPase FtsK/SpoIIIE
MPAAARTQDVPFLPPAWAAILKRNAQAALGATILAACTAATVALVSYSPTDPSFNTATPTGPQNLLGHAGALFADAALQTAGLASAALLLVIGAWGLRLVRGEAVGWLWLRTVGAIAATLALAMGLEGVPAPASWPIAAGLGGSAGQVLVDLCVRHGGLMARFHIVGEILRLSVAGTAALLGIGLLLWALTVGPTSIGAVMSRLLRALFAGGTAVVAWPWRQLGRWREAKAEAPRRARTEPRLAGETEQDENSAAPAVAAVEAPAAVEERRAEPAVVMPRAKPAKPSKRELEARQGNLLRDAGAGFALPPLDLLAPAPESKTRAISKESLQSNARMLESVLDDFGIKGQIVEVRPGPVVTLYELEPAPGTKTSRVVSLADDIARSMSAVSVRIAVIPGRSVIGIELPNASRETVYLREMLAIDAFEKSDGKLVLALGKDIGGAPIFADLARMPHLLIAGTTGSGKSVAVNTMIASLLYRNTPADVRFIMIDPKMLELSVYDGIPHLLAPVVTEPGKAVMALKWVVREMENRYRAMSQLSVRNIAGYNQRLSEAARKGKALTRTVQTGFDPATGAPTYEEQALDLTPLPYIVVIIDEMADLMLVAGKDVEAAVQRLAQMARAAGIHVIMATQRPSVDVITGTIKANFPTRISFQVTSKIDSRTILGEQGAEQLLGQGDMLYMAAGGRITRVHGPFCSDKEVESITEHQREQGEPSYLEEVTEEVDGDGVPGFATGGNTATGDHLFDQAVALVARERKASTSFIQRHLQIGYNRAARIIEEMEEQGMVSRANHVGKREVLLPQPQDA